MGFTEGAPSEPRQSEPQEMTPQTTGLPTHVSFPAQPHTSHGQYQYQSHPTGSSWGAFSAPVTWSILKPAFEALENSQRWSDEPFPLAWFLTPLFDFIQPDSLVFIDQSQPATCTENEDLDNTQNSAGRKTVALGSFLLLAGLLIMCFPSLPTLLLLRLGGLAAIASACLLVSLALPHSIPDFIVGANLFVFGLLLISFRGLGGFLVANVMAGWLFVKGFYRSCPCNSAFVGGVIVISSLFTSSVIGFLVGYDVMLCGLRVVATGKRLTETHSVP